MTVVFRSFWHARGTPPLSVAPVGRLLTSLLLNFVTRSLPGNGRNIHGLLCYMSIIKGLTMMQPRGTAFSTMSVNRGATWNMTTRRWADLFPTP